MTLEQAVDATIAQLHTRRDTRPTPANVQAVKHEKTTERPSAEQLIAKGHKSPSKRTQAAARNAQAALDKLQGYLTEERQRRERDAAEAAEKAKARDRIRELEEQLRAEKAKLKRRGTRTTGTHANRATSGVDTKKVRAWAWDNGYDCPRYGRVPTHIIDAYEAS